MFPTFGATMSGLPSRNDPHVNHPWDSHQHNSVSNAWEDDPLANVLADRRTSATIAPPHQPEPHPIKAKHHRRRHVPVGPAGVWFQAQQHSTGPVPFHKEEEEALHRNQERASTSSSDLPTATTSAWMCMQRDLNVVLPSLPPNLSIEERTKLLRPHMPANFTLLSQLARSHHWKNSCETIVRVTTINSLTDNLWTATVTDDTNTSMTAWIAPQLVKEEQQRPMPKYVRTGIVWRLHHPTLILGSSSQQDQVVLERVLLITPQTIVQVWSQAHAKEVSDTEYIQWMEKKHTLSNLIQHQWVVQHPQENRDKNDNCAPRTHSDDDDRVSSEDEQEWDDSSLGNKSRPQNTTISQRPTEMVSVSSSLVDVNAQSHLAKGSPVTARYGTELDRPTSLQQQQQEHMAGDASGPPNMLRATTQASALNANMNQSQTMSGMPSRSSQRVNPYGQPAGSCRGRESSTMPFAKPGQLPNFSQFAAPVQASKVDSPKPTVSVAPDTNQRDLSATTDENRSPRPPKTTPNDRSTLQSHERSRSKTASSKRKKNVGSKPRKKTPSRLWTTADPVLEMLLNDIDDGEPESPQESTVSTSDHSNTEAEGKTKRSFKKSLFEEGGWSGIDLDDELLLDD